MTWMIGAGSLAVAWLAWGMSQRVVSPDRTASHARGRDRERELLGRLEEIDGRFSDAFWRRYDQLVSMRKDEALVLDSPEHGELLRMTAELEAGQADRLPVAAELARIRGVPLADLLRGGEVAVWDHG